MVPSWPRCRCNTHTWLQVINTLLAFHTAGMPPATFTAKCKVSEREWGPDAVGSECVVHVRGGYLCHGTMDKAQYGGRGLLHATQVRCRLPSEHRRVNIARCGCAFGDHLAPPAFDK